MMHGQQNVKLLFLFWPAERQSHFYTNVILQRARDTLPHVKKRKLYLKQKSRWAGGGRFACPLLLNMDSIWNSLKSLNDTLSGADRIFQLYCPTLSPPPFARDPYLRYKRSETFSPSIKHRTSHQTTRSSGQICVSNSTTTFTSFRLNR